MLINKNIGDWCVNSKLIDDYAYQLYLNNKISNCCKQTQSYVIYCYYNEMKFKKYYNKANKYLMIEKLNIIKNGINI